MKPLRRSPILRQFRVTKPWGTSLLDCSLEHDFYPTEAEYGGTVQLLLEDEGWEPAQEFVLASRDWLANALDHGIEPSEVVQYVIAKY